ncbi:MAG: S9 family peptidase [Vicinamibacterales bacterium]
MTSRRELTVLTWLGVLLAAAVAGAQVRRPMTLVDLLEVPSLTNPQLSPDGRQLVYVLAEADWIVNRRVSHIWRVPVDGGAPVQMTSAGGENEPRWSPDGRAIAFVARRGDSPQIHVMRSDGGDARPLTNRATASPHPSAFYPRLSAPAWSPDGAFIYFLAFDPKTPAEEAREKAGDDVYAFDENYTHRHLWRVSVADGAEHRVTGGGFSILDYQLSRDGRKIVLHRAPTPLYGDSDRSEVWVMDASGQHATQITQNNGPESPNCCQGSGARISPDNTQVVFLAMANERFEFFHKASMFLAPAAGGPARMLLPEFPYDVQDVEWSGAGESIFFVANLGVHSELFRLDLAAGAPRQLTDGNHAIGWTLALPANRHVLTINQPTNAGDVWLLPADGTEGLRQVTRVFDYLARDFDLPRQTTIRWKGADGTTVEGLLYHPLDYRAGTRYPLVVQSHGGMATSDKFGFGRWSDYVQVLAARGFAVLKTNYRGSGGYGDAFQRDWIGHYFNNSHLDVLAGVDHVIKLGVADPDRLVKMGWSAGAFLTNKVLTHTTRFKAASTGAGTANWLSMYALSDVNFFRTAWFGGTPWQKDAPIEKYWSQSPLSAIANVKTPTLILVGERDVRVPPSQSIELYRALKSNGVPTRLYMAPREPHGWGELRHQLFKANVELDWFERYALGRQYSWERPPDGARSRPIPAATRSRSIR